MRLRTGVGFRVGKVGRVGVFVSPGSKHRARGRRTSAPSSGSAGCAATVLIVLAVALCAAMPWLLPVVVIAGVIILIIWIGSLRNTASAAPVVAPRTAKPGGSHLNDIIQNDIRIMNDCLNLVNRSVNIETVIYRYGALLSVLARLSEYENNPAVSFPRELPSDVIVRIRNEKTKIMTAAVERAYNDMLEKAAELKTENARKSRQQKFFDLLTSHASDFPAETNDFVQSLLSASGVEFINGAALNARQFAANKSSATDKTAGLKADMSLAINPDGSVSDALYPKDNNAWGERMGVDFAGNATVYNDGSYELNSFDYSIKNIDINSFLSLSQKITETRDLYEKLRICEHALPALPSFVNYCMKTDGELPPCIPCRDITPELFMRIGEWDKARKVIEYCVACGANDKGEIDELLAGLSVRHVAADAALNYLRETPGALQKDIYSIPALSSCSHDALVWFCRNSRQIRKEKYQNTNRLFAV